MRSNLILVAGTLLPSKAALHKQQGSLQRCYQTPEVRREAEEPGYPKAAWGTVCIRWQLVRLNCLEKNSKSFFLSFPPLS